MVIHGGESETFSFPVQVGDRKVAEYSADKNSNGKIIVIKGTAGPQGTAGTLHVSGGE